MSPGSLSAWSFAASRGWMPPLGGLQVEDRMDTTSNDPSGPRLTTPADAVCAVDSMPRTRRSPSIQGQDGAALI